MVACALPGLFAETVNTSFDGDALITEFPFPAIRTSVGQMTNAKIQLLEEHIYISRRDSYLNKNDSSCVVRLL